jgi:hypothetical protein
MRSNPTASVSRTGAVTLLGDSSRDAVPRRASQTEAGFRGGRIDDSLTALADAFDLLIDLRIFCSDLGVTWH